jgi:carbon storage regulator
VLVVSRKVGERILIGDQITVTVIKVGSGGVRIGIQAPRELAVVREELAELVRKAEQLKIDIAQQNTANGEQGEQASPPAGTVA